MQRMWLPTDQLFSVKQRNKYNFKNPYSATLFFSLLKFSLSWLLIISWANRKKNNDRKNALWVPHLSQPLLFVIFAIWKRIFNLIPNLQTCFIDWWVLFPNLGNLNVSPDPKTPSTTEQKSQAWKWAMTEIF